MNWDAVSAIAESVGVLSVFITLVYVAVEIHQHTNAVRASSLDAIVARIMEIRGKIMESEELTDIYVKGNVDPNSLTPQEGVRFRLLYYNLLWATWDLYSQLGFTGLSNQIWDSQKPTIVRVLTSPGGSWWWQEYKMEFEDHFRAAIDQIIDESRSSAEQSSPQDS